MSLGKSIHNYSPRMLVYGLFVSALLCAVVDAVPPLALVKRQAITPLSAAQISAFKPFTFFASTAYCNPSKTLNWNCGREFLLMQKNATSDLISISANCNANADFIPIASGGDGSAVQFCKLQSYLEHFWRLTSIRLGYVGFSPSQQLVIVAHQGTVTSKMHARCHSGKPNIAYVIYFFRTAKPT